MVNKTDFRLTKNSRVDCNYTTADGRVPARNLSQKELGAVIFGCKNHTIDECLKNNIFGLPFGHYSYVKNIPVGLTLFLFNYSDRTLHGIFEATSVGQKNIDAYAWCTSEGSAVTPYAAQVRFNVRKQCRALREDEFKPVIANNYYEDRLFLFELDKKQAAQLSTLFSSSTLTVTIPQRAVAPLTVTNPQSAVARTRISDAPVPGLNETLGHSYASVVVNSSNDDHASQNEWAKCVKDQGRDVDLYDGAFESVVAWESAEAVLSGESESSPEHDVQPNLQFGCLPANHICSGSEPVLMKLMQDMEGMRMFLYEQSVIIKSLKDELVGSKLEIDKLKKQYGELESTLSYRGELPNDDGWESVYFTSGEPLYIIGGYNGSSWTQDLSAYSPSLDNVKSLSSMTFARSYAALSCLNNELYLFGGFHKGVWYDTVESYNPMCNRWTIRPSLNQKKGSVAGASMHGKIYAIGGGNDGMGCFSEVEHFDINVGRWISTQSMIEKRLGPAAVHINDALYVAGGFDGEDFLRSVERLDPREPSWTSVQSMNSRRGGLSMVVCNEKLYALGGYDGSKMVSSAEVYDPRVGLWTDLEPMSVCRGFFGSFVSDGKIHVIGGLNEKSEALDVVECYVEGSGWQRSAKSSVLGERCYFASHFWEW